MSKPTPGPWATAKVDGVYWISHAITSADLIVGYAQSSRPEADANARLIAAAPDLLAACEAIYANIHPDTAADHSRELAEALDHVVRAISKARGTT